MRTLSSRLLAATAVLASALTVIVLVPSANAEGTGQVRITEFEYDGSEFIEFTNVTSSPISMSGWVFSDSHRATSGSDSTSLSSAGTLAGGESFLLVEGTAASFRSAWGSNVCSALKIVEGNGVNLGRSDEINIYNGSTLVDRLTYNDEGSGSVKSPRTNMSSARPSSSAALGANLGSGWVLSSSGDADGGWANSGRLGSPGRTQFGSYDECGGGGSSVTLTSAYPGLPAAIGDPTNPTLPVTVSPTTATLSVISSSNASVAATGGISFSGSGANRTVAVTPGSTEGYSDIVIRATSGSSTANLTFRYGLTRNHNDSTQRWYSGAGNASTAIDAGDDYAWVGDDEQQVLHLYNLEQSGPAVKTFDIAAQFGTSFSEEIDLEASVKIGSTIYWLGSMSNKNGGDESAPRNTLFATTISGTGASSTLTKTGVINTRMRQNLRALGTSGSDPYGLFAGLTSGTNGHDPSMANLEGMELAPDGTTVYLAFRGPIKAGQALIVPWTNYAAMTTSASANATFGTPFWLDLDGYGIRDIRKNAAGEYLISAGLTTESNDDYFNAGFRLYTWNGQPGTAPVNTGVTVPQMPAGASADTVGAWEAIVEMPDSLSGATVRMIQDDGDATPYGPANGSTKDDSGGFLFSRLELQKDLSLTFTLPTAQDVTSPVLTVPDATTIDFGAEFDPLEGVSATDDVDGDLTSEIEVDDSELDLNLPGVYSVHYEVSDAAGNTSTATQVVTIDKGAASISVSDLQAEYGDTVAAIVEIDGGPLAVAGSVQISDGQAVLGDASAAGGSAEIDLGALEPGEHTLTASYSGSAQLQTAETAFTVTIGPAATTVDASDQTVDEESTVELGVTVSSGSLTPTGSVEVFDDETSVGIGTLVDGGVTVDLGALPEGTHTLLISFAGNAYFGASEKTVTVTVEAVVPVEPQDIMVWADPTTQDLMEALAQEIDELNVAEPTSPTPGAPYGIDACAGEIPRPGAGVDYLQALFGEPYNDATGQPAAAPPAECGPTAVTLSDLGWGD